MWGEPVAIPFAIFASKSSAKIAVKTRECDPPCFTQQDLKMPKVWRFHKRLPFIFLMVFPTVFPRHFRAREQVVLLLTKAYPDQDSPDKGMVRKTRMVADALFGFIRSMSSPQSVVSNLVWKPLSLKNTCSAWPLLMSECFLVTC